MSVDEPSSLMNTINYYKGLLRFPQRNYAELEENQEQRELFFANSKQRKDESLKMLKEWAQNRMDIFEKNREIVEELANQSDYKIRISVDFLQIIYKFFNEQYFHEQQYAQFLLTKPQPSMKHNPLANGLYGGITETISTFEEDNLKRCERVANFAHDIQTSILKGSIFAEFAEMDKKSDQLLSGIIMQKKLLQTYITNAGTKLNQIISQFPRIQQTPRTRRPIFDEPEKKSDKILNNISTLGALLVGAPPLQDPVEAELNRQIKEQEIMRLEGKIQETQLKEEQSLSNGDEQDKAQNEHQQEQEQEQQQQQQQNQQPAEGELQSQQIDNSSKDSNLITSEIPQENIKPQEEQINQSISSAQRYKNQQKEQTILKQNQQQQNQQQQLQQQLQQQQQQPKSNLDLYHLIISFIQTQQQAIKQLNLLAQKSVQYWKHVMDIESKRAIWASESVEKYQQGILNAYGTQLLIPSQKIQTIEEYRLYKLLPKELGLNESTNDEDFLTKLQTDQLQCQASKLLIIKQFTVTILDKLKESPCLLILSIDKFVGCWQKNEEELEDADHPVFHFHLESMAYQKYGSNQMDIMPSKHVLFLNIANDRHKCRVKFISPDDVEEFCTIVESQK